MAKQTIKRFDTDTIGDLFNDFYREKTACNRSASTLRNYKQSYEYFLTYNELTTATPADTITVNHIYTWIEKMKEQETKASTMNHYLRDIRTFLYWCMDCGKVESFKIHLTEAQQEIPKHFSDTDLKKLTEKPAKRADYTEWRVWAVVNWILATGNRAGTVCNIKMQDIDFNAKTVTITYTKRKKAQILPMSSGLEKALKEYINMWRKYAADDDYLFSTVCEEKLTVNALSHSFQKYCARREVKQTNLHGLRHSFARNWIINGGNEFKLQKVLGHSSLDMTRKYVTLYSDDLRQDYESFSALDTITSGKNRTHTIKRCI